MIDAYKRFPLRYPVIVIGLLSLAAGFFSWQQGHSPLLVGGLTLAGLTLLHIFLTKLNSLLAFIIIFIQAFIYASFIYGVYAYANTVALLLTIDINLIATMLTSYALVLLASYVYVGYKFSRGRLWLNLLTAFIISGLTSAIVLIISPLFYLVALAVGFFSGLAYLILRTPNKKKRPEAVRKQLTDVTKKKTENLLEEDKLKYVYLDNSSSFKAGHYFAYNDRLALAITVVSPYKSFSITEEGILCDDMNLVPLLEYNQEEILNQKSIRSENITSVLLVLSNSQKLKPLTSVSISRWKQPDYSLGVVNIMTVAGFKRFIRASQGEMKPFKSKNEEKINIFFQNLTTN